jgi:mannose-6-phosphate isomerase-like protein (cupin superfamily)
MVPGRVGFFQVPGAAACDGAGMSQGHRITNLADVEDIAPKFGMDAMGEARFLRGEIGAERIGLSHYRVKPGARTGFGHTHRKSEEVYLVLSGSGTFKVDDQLAPVRKGDVVFCPPGAMREWEGGEEGLELVAFGEHVEGDAEMVPGWWPARS